MVADLVPLATVRDKPRKRPQLPPTQIVRNSRTSRAVTRLKTVGCRLVLPHLYTRQSDRGQRPVVTVPGGQLETLGRTALRPDEEENPKPFSERTCGPPRHRDSPAQGPRPSTPVPRIDGPVNQHSEAFAGHALSRERSGA